MMGRIQKEDTLTFSSSLTYDNLTRTLKSLYVYGTTQR